MNSTLLFFDYARRSQLGSFHRLLQLVPKQYGGSLEVREIRENVSFVETNLPVWMWCSDGINALSGIMALMVEISTYAGFVPWDQYNRPGVSLQVSARCLRPLELKKGDRLTFETQLLKIGRSIGFVDVIASDEHGTPLVTMQHIKFMPSMPLFHLLFHPVFQNATIPLAHSVLGYTLNPPTTTNIPNKIDELFELKEEEEANTTDPNRTRFTTSIDERHGNALGTFHSGAAIILSTLAASKLATKLAGKPHTPMTMRTTLLSGVSAAHPHNLKIESTYSEPTKSSRTMLMYGDNTTADTEVDWW